MEGQTIILSGRNSVVECQLPKLDVAGSSPVARFSVPIMKRADLRAGGRISPFDQVSCYADSQMPGVP